MKFYGELGCGLETNWLHFGDDPHHYPDPWVRSGLRITIRIREELPHCQHTQNKCPQRSPNEFNFGDDPDHRPGSRSPKSEIRIHWIIDYADVRRGLRSLSTSSLTWFKHNFELHWNRLITIVCAGAKAMPVQRSCACLAAIVNVMTSVASSRDHSAR